MLDRVPAMGCMRLSTEPDRDDDRAIATIHAALDAGVRLLDTADAYCRDASEAGHNERLIARALASWDGDASAVRVATKGGLVRPGGRWEADGRARHLRRGLRGEPARRSASSAFSCISCTRPIRRSRSRPACARWPRCSATGWCEHVGLCNVTVAQLHEARDLVEVASVQIELSPWHEAGFRSGVAESCAEHGIRLLAYRPLGGAAKVARLARDPVIAAIAQRHGATAAEVVLAWLRDARS